MQSKTKSADYRRALAQFATGVTVVTTRARDGDPVSLEPPLVLWSLALKASSLPAFESCSHYAINVLSERQLGVAQRFATRGADRFGPDDWRAGPFDLPLLEGCVATLVATNRSRYREGDHVILVGEVVRYDVRGGDPLVFHDGRYITSAIEEPLPDALRTPWR
jgi:flavin reductase (DIM6/NTAB) family NADH-FMN oxidoreductase RutF